MNGAKITLYVIAGVLIANLISYFAYRQLGNTINNSEANAVLETPEQDSSGTVYNGFNTPKLNVTIKNGSGNRLICLSYQNKEPKQFLSLEGKQERQFIRPEYVRFFPTLLQLIKKWIQTNENHQTSC